MNRAKRIFCRWWVVVVVACVGCVPAASRKGEAPLKKPEVASPHLQVEAWSKGLPQKGHFRQNVVVVDLNNDGYLDIVAPPPRLAKGASARPQIFLGDGNGGWRDVSGKMRYPKGVELSYGSIGVGDFNEDGRKDLILAMHKKGLRLLLRSGEWSWTSPEEPDFPTALQYPTRTLRVGDIDKDGHLDFVCLGELIEKGPYATLLGWGIVVFKGDGKGGFSAKWLKDSEGLFGDDLAFGDVNGDGWTDIAAATRNSSRRDVVWINPGKGGFQFLGDPGKGLLEEATAYDSVCLADMNGDGLDDLVAGIMKMNSRHPDPNGIRVYYRRNNGWREDARGFPTQPRFGAVAAWDINGDGRRDVVGLEFFTGVVRFFLQAPEGGFRESPVSLKPGRPARGYGMAWAPMKDGSFLLVTALAKVGDQGGGLNAYRIGWMKGSK